MNLFYISYWGLNDGLSRSTSQPNIEILSSLSPQATIYYFTIERDDDLKLHGPSWSHPRCVHIPFHTRRGPLPRLLSNFLNMQRYRRLLFQTAAIHPPDLIISRGSMAGDYGRWLRERTRSRLLVESFEPHADYMTESGVWTKHGIPVRIQRKSEAAIKRHAFRLHTVTDSYRQQLINHEGIASEKILTVPCCVNPDKFNPGPTEKTVIRKQLGIPEHATVGIYVGKFGGIYFDDEAFRLFRSCFDHYQENFHLILLTPKPAESMRRQLQVNGIPEKNVHISSVTHDRIPGYLTAADFAISAIKPSPSRLFCSPIKDGEYWSCGLPILIPDGIGDDSDIVRKEEVGAIFDIDSAVSVQQALNTIDRLLQQPDHRARIRTIGIQHRGPEHQWNAYEELLSAISHELKPMQNQAV